MKLLVIGALAALPVSAQAAPDVPCADVQRLAATASEARAFGSLKAEGFAPRLLPGCFPTVGGYFCHRSLLPPEITHASMAQAIADCLPDSEMAAGENAMETVVRRGALRITLTESGNERAHVGRMLDIAVGAEP